MPMSQMPDDLPVITNGEGPDDTGVTQGAVTPEPPDLKVQGGDDVAQQLEEMEKRVFAGASDEVQEATADVEKENPNEDKTEDLDADENPRPENDQPA